MSGDSKRQLSWEVISAFSEAQEGRAYTPVAEPLMVVGPHLFFPGNFCGRLRFPGAAEIDAT